MTIRIPLRQVRIDVEGIFCEVDLWIGFAKIQAGRNLSVLEREDCLDEPGYPGSRVQMPDIRFN